MAAAVSTKKDKTRKLALSTGISLFVCIGGNLFLGYGDLVYAIFVGLLSVIIIGPILMITRIPFLRVPRTKWWVTAGSYLLHPLLGIILCGSAGLLHTKIPMGAWVPTEPAPEKPARFVVSPVLNIFGGSINIETESGNLYTYECENYFGCVWNRLEEVPDESDFYDLGYSSCGNQNSGFPAPIFLGKKLDSMELSGCGPDFGIDSKYIIKGNGEILVWTRYWSALGLLVVLTGFCIAGLFSGIVGAVHLHLLRDKKPVDTLIQVDPHLEGSSSEG